MVKFRKIKPILAKISELHIDRKLLKLGLFNSASLGFSTILGVVATKTLAIFLGVQNFGIFGIYRDFLMLISNVATLGVGTGVIKYTAEQKNHPEKLISFFSSVLVLALVCTLVFGLSIYFSAAYLSKWLLQDTAYYRSFYWMALLLLFIIFHTLLVAIFKGLGLTKQVIVGTLINAMVLLVLYLIFLPGSGLKGAFLVSLLAFLITATYFFFALPRKYVLKIRPVVNWQHLKDLSAYTGMAMFSLITFPLVKILVKNSINLNLGQIALSYWEASHRISASYTMFGFSLLSLFVIPKLSMDQSYVNYKSTVRSFLTTIFPFFALFLGLIYIFKEPFIRLLLTDDYLEIQPLMKWFFIGDIFRMLTLLFATYFHAVRAWRQYLISDIILAFFQYFFMIYLIQKSGLKGGALAYCVSFIVYFATTLFLLSQMNFFKDRKSEL